MSNTKKNWGTLRLFLKIREYPNVPLRRYKDLRIFHLDIPGLEKAGLLFSSLTELSLADNPVSSYPFFYSPGLLAAATSDGWSLFPPEQEFLAVTAGSQEWRITRPGLALFTQSEWGYGNS